MARPVCVVRSSRPQGDGLSEVFARMLAGQDLALTAGSSSSIELEPVAEPEIDVATLGEEELRTELVKVCLLSEASSAKNLAGSALSCSLPLARQPVSLDSECHLAEHATAAADHSGECQRSLRCALSS